MKMNLYSVGVRGTLKSLKNGLNTDVWDCGTFGTQHTPYIYTEYIYKMIYILIPYIVYLKICPTVPQHLETLINTGLFCWDIQSHTFPQVPHKRRLK